MSKPYPSRHPPSPCLYEWRDHRRFRHSRGGSQHAPTSTAKPQPWASIRETRAPSLTSPRLRPTLRKRQRAGAERLPLSCRRKRNPLRQRPVHRHPRPQRRDQHRADTVFACRGRAWLGVDQQRLTDVIPGKRDLLVVRIIGGISSSQVTGAIYYRNRQSGDTQCEIINQTCTPAGSPSCPQAPDVKTPCLQYMNPSDTTNVHNLGSFTQGWPVQ